MAGDGDVGEGGMGPGAAAARSRVMFAFALRILSFEVDIKSKFVTFTKRKLTHILTQPRNDRWKLMRKD